MKLNIPKGKRKSKIICNQINMTRIEGDEYVKVSASIVSQLPSSSNYEIGDLAKVNKGIKWLLNL